MKKFMSIMLALALTTGVATITLAQDGKDDKKTTTKKGKGKKGKTADTTTPPAKGKGKKGKTATDDKK
jgi:hypothetical protein